MRVFTALPMTDWRETGPAARAAEDIGFDVLRTAELGYEVFIPLAFAALATERVELTPSVAIAFPRSPTVMASIAWDLQANSRGRFVLGLGSQVKGHNERRFGIAWTPPAPRMRDYIGALRAIWRCWETRGKLDYHSDHYTLTLMTPAFSPEPSGLPMVPVTISAVGEAMLRVAGQVADGVRLHPLCSRRYLLEISCPLSPKAWRAPGVRANTSTFTAEGSSLPAPMRRRWRRPWTDCASALPSTAPRAPIFQFWRCTGWKSWGRSCTGCRSPGAGGTWRPRSPMTSCTSLLHAPLTMGLLMLLRSVLAALRTRLILNFRPTHRWACNANCWRTSAASRIASLASIRPERARLG